MEDDVRHLIDHFFGLCSGTVCEAVLRYMDSSDCSPSTRQRIKNYFTDEKEILLPIPEPTLYNFDDGEECNLKKGKYYHIRK